MKQPKQIPYGQTNFEKIRTNNYLYVDKTRFIEQLENESTDFHFLIRPRKFGKTLFLSVLDITTTSDMQTNSTNFSAICISAKILRPKRMIFLF
jgi:hypothetical protein